MFKKSKTLKAISINNSFSFSDMKPKNKDIKVKWIIETLVKNDFRYYDTDETIWGLYVNLKDIYKRQRTVYIHECINNYLKRPLERCALYKNQLPISYYKSVIAMNKIKLIN